MSQIRSHQNIDWSHWDWTPYNVHFGPHMTIGDGDGVFERNGEVIFLEGKRPGEEVPLGQRIMHKCLAYKYGFTVVYLWGNPEAYEVEHAIIQHRKGAGYSFQCNHDEFGEFVLRPWFRWAEVSGTGQYVGDVCTEPDDGFTLAIEMVLSNHGRRFERTRDFGRR